MAISTYKQLSDSIKAWSKRTELDPLILADIISITETKIDTSDLRLESDEATWNVTLQTNDNYVGKPPRYKAIRSVRVEYGSKRPHIKYVTPAMLNYNSTPGLPHFFTITDAIEFDRIPDQNYKIFIDYHKTLDALDPSIPESTNNILLKYPVIYLYGALEEVFNYVLDEKRAAGYRKKFYAMIAMANEQEHDGRFPVDNSPTPTGFIV